MDGNRVIQKLLVTLLAQYHFVTLPEISFPHTEFSLGFTLGQKVLVAQRNIWYHSTACLSMLSIKIFLLKSYSLAMVPCTLNLYTQVYTMLPWLSSILSSTNLTIFINDVHKQV